MLAVMLLNVIGPTLLDRFARLAHADITLSICSSSGVRTLALASDHDTSSDHPSGQHPSQHCALCMLGQSWLPPADPAMALPYWVRESAPYPPIADALPHTRLDWVRLPARAPPSLLA